MSTDKKITILTVIFSILIGCLEAIHVKAEEYIEGNFDGYHGKLLEAVDYYQKTDNPCTQYGTSMNDEHITCVRGFWYLRKYNVLYSFNGKLYQYTTFTYPNEIINTDSEGVVRENNDTIYSYH